MKRKILHIILVLYILFSSVLFPLCVTAQPTADIFQYDSVRVEELLVKDTVDLKIDGPSSDVNFYMNGMVFLSNTKYHQKMIPDHITFGVVKAYFVPLEYIALESSRPLLVNDDFPYSPGGMSFTRDYQTVYFTKPVDLYGRRDVEKIFEMSIINGEGSDHKQMSFTENPSRYLHPAISLDDSYMIFSSDRTPTAGGLDLFLSRKTPSGWSTPVNMGSNINTSGHEWYPYLDHKNNLYFSSSGHMGFGGYDVYVCYFDGSSWGEPHNMTELINSPGDDLGFTMHPNKKAALFSKVEETESQGEVYKLGLNDKALLLSGIEDPHNQDMAGLLEDMLTSGYTAGAFATTTEVDKEVEFIPSALPLLAEAEETKEPVSEPEKVPEPEAEPAIAETEVVPVVLQPETEPEPVIETGDTEPVLEAELMPEADPNQVVFRVQILSRTKANSSPSVTVAGTRYQTFEYFYKGAYRITVGEFKTVKEASTFRLKCRSSGFNQAFVAAFRGNERETDPSVFRQ